MGPEDLGGFSLWQMKAALVCPGPFNTGPGAVILPASDTLLARMAVRVLYVSQVWTANSSQMKQMLASWEDTADLTGQERPKEAIRPPELPGAALSEPSPTTVLQPSPRIFSVHVG